MDEYETPKSDLLLPRVTGGGIPTPGGGVITG